MACLLLIAPGHSSLSGSFAFLVTSPSAKTEVPCLLPRMRQRVVTMQNQQHDEIHTGFNTFPEAELSIQPQHRVMGQEEWDLKSSSSFKCDEFEPWCSEASGLSELCRKPPDLLLGP